MRKVQRTAWEGAVRGGGAESERTKNTGTGRSADTVIDGAAMVAALFGATNCEAGSGLPGETRQHVEVWESAWMLTGVRAVIFAIMEQWGRNGVEPGCAGIQQPTRAIAGPASMTIMINTATDFA